MWQSSKEGYKFCQIAVILSLTRTAEQLSQSVKQLLHLLLHEAKNRQSRTARLIDIIITYRIHGAQKAKRLFWIGWRAVKVQRNYTRLVQWGYRWPSLWKIKNDTDWYSFEDLVSYELIVNNQTVVSGCLVKLWFAQALCLDLLGGCRCYRINENPTSKIWTLRVTSNEDFNKPVIFIDD